MTLLSDAPVHSVEVLADLAEVVATVDVHGPLDVVTLPRVRAALDDELATRPSRLVVDLADCPHVDASGLAVLLDVHRRMSRYGGLLTLRAASPRVVRVLSLTGLRHVFDLG